MSVPDGTIVAFAGSKDKIKEGWLECDGRSVSKHDYPELYDAISVIYGGNGAPNFNLPDLRGMFLRGVDGGRGKDPDPNDRQAPDGTSRSSGVGSTQDDLFGRHDHVTDGNSAFGLGTHDTYYSAGDGADHFGRGRNMRTSVEGGNETRPKNVYVYYIIKATFAP